MVDGGVIEGLIIHGFLLGVIRAGLGVPNPARIVDDKKYMEMVWRNHKFT
jgi:hypothetical protein